MPLLPRTPARGLISFARDHRPQVEGLFRVPGNAEKIGAIKVRRRRRRRRLREAGCADPARPAAARLTV